MRVSQGGLFIFYLFDEYVVVRLCAEECVCVCVCVCVCMCVCVAVRPFHLFIFEEDVGLRHCAESSFSFASVCVCVLHRVAFKDCFAALKGIPRVEFKDSVTASVFMFWQRYVCRTGWTHGWFATSFTRSYVGSRVCNDEMISHILGKLIMGRDLQCELSFSAAHAMTKYEV